MRNGPERSHKSGPAFSKSGVRRVAGSGLRCVMENQVINARTVLAVNDLAVSVAYFIDKLGFERDFAVPGWEFLSFGNFQVILGEFPDAMPARDLGEHAFTAYARVRDVDALYADLKARGADFAEEPPYTEPWGMREILVVTPDGHTIKYGQTVRPDGDE